MFCKIGWRFGKVTKVVICKLSYEKETLVNKKQYPHLENHNWNVSSKQLSQNFVKRSWSAGIPRLFGLLSHRTNAVPHNTIS